jgi:hypothetical protein
MSIFPPSYLPHAKLFDVHTQRVHLSVMAIGHCYLRGGVYRAASEECAQLSQLVGTVPWSQGMDEEVPTAGP